MLQVCRQARVPIEEGKSEGPASFLGIEIDSVAMELTSRLTHTATGPIATVERQEGTQFAVNHWEPVPRLQGGNTRPDIHEYANQLGEARKAPSPPSASVPRCQIGPEVVVPVR